MNEKLKKIEMLLENENLFEQYVCEIENSELEVPYDLNQNIKSKLDAKILQPKSKNKKYFDILRLVACSVFAIMMWEMVLSKPVTYGNSQKIEKTSFMDAVDNAIMTVNNYLLQPKTLERREK